MAPILSVGLDLQKRYSQVEALDESGERRSAARLVNEFEEVEGFFRSLGKPCRVVLEATILFVPLRHLDGQRSRSLSAKHPFSNFDGANLWVANFSYFV